MMLLGQSVHQGKHLTSLLYLLPIKALVAQVFAVCWKLTHQQWSPKSVTSASTVRHVYIS